MTYEPRAPSRPRFTTGAPLASRTVFSAAHVVADPFADAGPDGPAAVDWDATLAFRRHLWSHGLGVAEAMDTAQRGMGLDWAGAAELIRRSAAEAKAVGGAHRLRRRHRPAAAGPATLAEVRAAYEEQLALVEETGAQADPDGLAGAGGRGDRPRGLPGGLRASAAPGRRAGHPALARPDVRPGAGRLLGLAGPRRRHRDVPGGHRRAPRQGRRHQGLAPGRPARGRRCAAASRRACAATPATTSTTPS